MSLWLPKLNVILNVDGNVTIPLAQQFAILCVNVQNAKCSASNPLPLNAKFIVKDRLALYDAPKICVRKRAVLDAKLCVLPQSATLNVLPQNRVATLFVKKPNVTGNAENPPPAPSQNATFNATDLLANQVRNPKLHAAHVPRRTLGTLSILLSALLLAPQLILRYFHHFWRLCIVLNYRQVKAKNLAVLAVLPPIPLTIKLLKRIDIGCAQSEYNKFLFSNLLINFEYLDHLYLRHLIP